MKMPLILLKTEDKRPLETSNKGVEVKPGWVE
jgi:hypothetical protein